MNSLSRAGSHQAAAGTSRRNGTSTGNAQNDADPIQMASYLRAATNYFEKFDRNACQQLLAQSSTHWILSTEDFRLPTEPPVGLISRMCPFTDQHALLLLPIDNAECQAELDLREFHQIIRELMLGIYALNQTPKISLEANFDGSTSCQIPPAYIDTRIGQMLINVDYMIKALWHGAYFPKDKRAKFSEKWRSNLDVNSNGKPETKKPLLTEFITGGMLDITKDPDFVGIYDNIALDLAADAEMAEERRFFMSLVDSVSMQMTLYQNAVLQQNNLFIINADWLISSVVKLTDDKLDHSSYERLTTRLQLHEKIITENLLSKAEIRRSLLLLKFVSFMVPFLIGLRKRMKIPDMSHLLTPLTGDETRTEHELPPLMVGPDFKCKTFRLGNHYSHLHGGIIIDIETNQPTGMTNMVTSLYEELLNKAKSCLDKYLDPDIPLQEHYPVPTHQIDGQTYAVILVALETFYPTSPQKPLWIRPYFEELLKLKPRRLPLTDLELHEQFKKLFGTKKAITYKTPHNGLRACSRRGLVAMFQTLCRKMQTNRLNKQDDQGLSYLHHAAMNNRPQVIALLLLQSMDINMRKNNHILSTDLQGNHGNISSDVTSSKECTAPDRSTARSLLLDLCPTALHLAARCGALDAVTCLIANYASLTVTDKDGWSPIHHAAYFDHEPIIRAFVRKNNGLLDIQTKNDQKSTPLLLAASSGALAALKCLIRLGGDVVKMDMMGNGIVSLSTIRFHTNVLEYLIEWDNTDVPVWKTLIAMLRDENFEKKDSAVKCLEVLSTSKPDHWKAILDADGIPALVDLLTVANDDIQSVAASVLCNISEQEPIRMALSKTQAGGILVQLLGSSVDEIQSRAAIIIADLACVEENQDRLSEHGVIPQLVNLLDSELEDVLVNTVNALRVLCSANHGNQTAVDKCDGVESLVEFLTVNSEILQAATAATLAALTKDHHDNQNSVIQQGAAKPLVNMIKAGRDVTVQVKAAAAMEALAYNNNSSQDTFLQLDAPKALIRLLKNINTEVREQGACTLWALAGHTKTQQRYIAERVGIPYIIQMLLEPTEKLLHVGCMTAIALGRENIDSQNQLAAAETFQQLVRLLRSYKTSDQVLLMVIKVIGTLCVGVAYRNNRHTQRKIADEGAIPVLVKLIITPPTQEIQVEAANTLACVMLSNHDNQEILKELPHFKFGILLDLLQSPNEEIHLKAGMALAIFAFNNIPQQYEIREAGGVSYAMFLPFLMSDNEAFQCYSAFQLTVLARVVTDNDQVSLTAQGVTLLVSKLDSDDNNTVVLASSLLSSLAHTRAGIPDAMVTTGAIVKLVQRLFSESDQVRNAAAVALGYLTCNKTASRTLMASCRNTPGLYDQLMENIGRDARVSAAFIDEFRRAKIIGLPSQSLEINGGPPVIPLTKSRAMTRRPNTSYSSGALRHPNNSSAIGRKNRAVSAPAIGHRVWKQQPIMSKQTLLTGQSGFSSAANQRIQDRPLSGASTSYSKKSSAASFKTQLSAWKSDKQDGPIF